MDTSGDSVKIGNVNVTTTEKLALRLSEVLLMNHQRETASRGGEKVARHLKLSQPMVAGGEQH